LNHSVLNALFLSFSSTRRFPMPAQSTPYRGQSTGSTQDLKEKATDQFEKIADTAADKFRDVADQAEHIASRVAEQGREVGDKVQQVAGNIKGAVGEGPADGDPCDGRRPRLRPRRDLEVVIACPQ
jgi:hypothetical protein